MVMAASIIPTLLALHQSQLRSCSLYHSLGPSLHAVIVESPV